MDMSDPRDRRKPQKRQRPSSEPSGSGRSGSGSSKKSKPRQRTEPKGAPRAKPSTRRQPAVRGRAKTTSAPPRRPATKGGRRPPQSAAKRKPAAPRSKRQRRLKIAALLALLALIILSLSGAIAFAALSRGLPDLNEPLKGRDQTSKVYDKDGELITELFAEQNRTRVPLADIPVDLRNAVIATEDERFYEHQGVDPWGILRALWVDIRTRSAAQGGSTITQQYVVNAFVEREDTLTRKVKEAILAFRLEKGYSKDQILEMYLNTIYFGHGAYSVETAAQTYFGKSVAELTLAESATLAGVIKSPARFSPYLDPTASAGRRRTVLGQMLDQNFISQAQYDEAAAAELALAGLGQDSAAAPYFVEYVKSILAFEYGEDALYRGGLSVTTTLDLDMQRAAEAAIAASLDQPEDPSAALVAIDPTTGAIRAMVGGRDFSKQQYNVAAQGRRQPGSSFKPFLLVTALERGVFPEQTFESGPVALSVPGTKEWKVTGASGGRSGPMRLREALEKSVNSVFAQLILDVGPDRVVETASRMGIENDVVPVAAIALGGLETGVSPLEMASAYGTLAAGGVRHAPFAVGQVVNADGESIYSAEASSQPAVDPAVAYLATDMLKGVISKGTGRAAAIGRPAAGKTGTTQEYRDAWFAGYTPELVAAVWVGHPEQQIEMKNVHGRVVTGGSFPAEIWASFMKAALASVPASDFEKPSGLASLKICLDTGQQATEFCPTTGTGLFLKDHVPGDCEVHAGPTIVDLPNLIGKTKEEAIAALNQLLLLFKITEKEVAGVPAGIVADQTPKGGSKVTTETVVGLTVSTGRTKNEPPVASFSFSPAEPSSGTLINFDGTGSSDDGTIVSWLWEFGDGSEGAGRNASHAYSTAGDFSVTLWVTDDRGAAASKTLVVPVR